MITLKSIAIVTLLMSAQHTYAQRYALSRDQASNLNNIDALVRYDETTIDIKSESDAAIKKKYIVTILNQQGREFGIRSIQYNKLYSLEKLHGKLYDSNGNKIRELSDIDINDYSAISGYSLYEDSRVRVANLFHNEYPYTVEYDYEMNSSVLFSLPDWYPERSRAKVEYSSFEIISPNTNPIRYLSSSDSLVPQKTSKENKVSYKWELKSIDPFVEEPLSSDYIEQAIFVRVAVEHFELEGYRGSMTTWEAFGQVMNSIFTVKEEVPPALHTEINKLLNGISNKKEKIKLLYEYLQNKTRYVSVQLGIGGFQPFSSKYVYDRGYGDCKALTNYMRSILNIASIESYPVLTRLGDGRNLTKQNFISDEFNHVILCVPISSDTIWLECTSQLLPMGKISNENENRFALLLSEKGSKLIRTPSSSYKDNLQYRNAKIILDENGVGKVSIKKEWRGNQSYERLYLSSKSKLEQEKWLQESLTTSSTKIIRSDFSGIEPRKESISINYDLEINNLALVSGTRLFISPNLFIKKSYVPPELTQRKTSICYDYPYKDVDSIFCQIPRGYTVESVPKKIKLETDFASFENEFVMNDQNLLYIRKIEIKQSDIQAAKYSDYREFMKKIAQADKMQLVYVKQ